MFEKIWRKRSAFLIREIKIKKRQEKQIKELSRLKKKGVKKDKIKTQLEKWKKQGYGFPEIKEEIPEKSINKQIKSWKNAGYKFE